MKPRYFALVPAAGHSTRMREPKLLLPLAGQPLILHTIAAWRRSMVSRILVVIRTGDEELANVLKSAAAIDVVIPSSPPADMKASLQAALRHIEREYSPTPADAFLVAPADIPRLSAAIIDRLIDQHASNSPASVLAPTLGRSQGHPVLFPWPLASKVYALAPDEGLNAIVHRHPPVLVPCEDLIAPGEYPFADIDTSEQYEQLTNDRMTNDQ